MRIAVTIGVAAASLAVSALMAPAASGASVGQRAPEIDLPTVEGVTVTRARLLGQPAAVLFVSLSSGSLRASIKDLQRLRAASGNRLRVLVIAVGADAAAARRALARRRLPADVTLALDRRAEVARRWGATSVPATVLVDAFGVVRYVERGWDAGYRGRVARQLRGGR